MIPQSSNGGRIFICKGNKTMKSKSIKNSHKVNQAKSADNGGGPNVPTGKWTQWIEPKGAALLSQTLGPIHFVIKNHGAHTIRLVAHQGDIMDLSPGAVRATYARGAITVENGSEKSVLIEFEFLPVCLKP
jgi:hypothetical protein